MEVKFVFVLLFGVQFLSNVYGMAVSSTVIRTCCALGTQRGKDGSCGGKPSVPQVAAQERLICEASSISCCLEEKQRQSCNKGVEKAMRMQNCSSGDSCGVAEQLCCGYCNYGFTFAAAGHNCNSITRSSAHDTVSKMCCEQMMKDQSFKNRYAKAKTEDKFSTKETCADRKCTYKCKETESGPFCVCPTGYSISSDGFNCVDVDECKKNASICKVFSTCFNTAGSYYCSRKPKCGEGYELSGSNCVDINECVRNPKICGNGICLNQPGSYNCRCNSGYMFNTTSKKCEEFNACDTANCGYKCQNFGGGRYRCLCPKGKVLSADRRTCRDFDPCEGNKCEYKCQAVSGNRYRCLCQEGYQIQGDGLTCKVNTYRVALEVKNIDPVVSYTIQWHENKLKKKLSIPTTTTIKRNIVFKSAKKPEPLQFQLFDMKNRLIKINGKESFEVTPHLGEISVTLNVGQNDDNACRTSPCKANQNCESLGGRRYRCTCRSGYKMRSDGACEVVRDPCSSNPCQHRCYNMGGGSFFCTCPYGKTLNTDKRTCKTIDPCTRKFCQYKCRRNGDRAECLCPSGYKVHGQRCVDIDECNRRPCDTRYYECVNTYGSYKCASNKCPKRYFKSYGNRYCYKPPCAANDYECKNDTVTSHQWLHSKMPSNVRPDSTSYTYRVYRPAFNHRIAYRIVSGNEDNAFYLTRESDYKIKISNQKKLVGPKEYKLQLLTSIFKDGALNTQFMTTYYIYVSAYGFF